MLMDPDSLQTLAKRCGLPPDHLRLLAWDANSVHNFVFDTTNAAAIRGASHLLKKLDDQLESGKGLNLEQDQILFAGGGSGLALISKDQEPQVIRKLHRLYTDKTRTATCCCAAVDATDNFQQHYKDVQNLLNWERAHRGPDASPAVPFFVQRCEVCGHRAATRVEDKRIGGPRPECLVCHHCIEAGKSNRQAENEISDFDFIADSKGYLAVIYIDGNGIGRRLSLLPSPDAYKTFSRALVDIVQGSFNDVARQFGLKQDEDIAFGNEAQGKAFQRPICGGDDLVAILPGDVAVPFARDLLARIEQASDGHEGLQHEAFKGLDPIGAAAGVALGKGGFPIRHLLQEAEDLLKSAKKRVYRDGVRSALDFIEIGDGSPRRESFTPPRLEISDEKPPWFHSGRPFSLAELQTFSQRFDTVRRTSLGKSQLYALRTYAQAGPAQLRNHVLYQVGRREGWQNLIRDLAGNENAKFDPDICVNQMVPTYSGDRVFDIADMLELWSHWPDSGKDAHS